MLLAVSSATNSAKPAAPTSVEFGAGAWVDVDATGKAHVVEMDRLSRFTDDGKPGAIADIIKARLRERIESWEFTPPTRDGVAVSGKTHLGVSLEASSEGGRGLTIRVLDAGTGAKLANRPMGELIRAKMDYGYSGQVVVDMAWKSDGSIDAVTPVNSMSPDAQSKPKPVSPKFLKAVLRAMKDWRFDPEIVAGTPIPGKGTIPIAFCWGGKSCESDASTAKPSRADLVASNPAVGLRTEVAGLVL